MFIYAPIAYLIGPIKGLIQLSRSLRSQWARTDGGIGSRKVYRGRTNASNWSNVSIPANSSLVTPVTKGT
jgi:hypothetical protein